MPKAHGAGKGSLIIELGVLVKIAGTIGIIVLGALKITEKLFAIRKTAEEIRNLQLQNRALAGNLEEEIEKEKEVGAGSIVRNVMAQVTADEIDGEQRASLKRSVEKLLDFLDKGGEVDCLLPEESDEGESPTESADLSELRVTFREIREIEYSLQQRKLLSEGST